MNGALQLTITHQQTVTQADIDAFNTAAGLSEPGGMGRGLFVAALTTRILQQRVLGQHDVYLSQSLKCYDGVQANDQLNIHTTLHVQAVDQIVLLVEVKKQNGKLLLVKTAVIHRHPTAKDLNGTVTHAQST